MDQYLLQIALFFLLLGRHLHSALADDAETGFEGYRIAIIGGGISGTFTAKYLTDYDVSYLHKPVNGKRRERCLLDEITVFDISPPPPGFSSSDEDYQHTVKSSSDPRPENWQGSRVSSITVKETVIELGASIIYDGNQLVVDMMNGDPDNLARAEPMMGSTKQQEEEEEGSNVDMNEPFGFGIYHGNKEWLFKTNHFSQYPTFLRKILTSITFLWRYNLDYFTLQKAVKQTVRSFDVVYSLLNDTQHELTYFDSPMDLLEAIGLRSASSISFHDLLDGLGLSRNANLEMQQQSTDDNNIKGWWDWRKWLPGMGCLRSELVTAMTINTYNKDLNEMNGLVGLVAYIPSSGGELFSIEGGNHKLMESALQQAKKTYDSSSICKSPKERIQRKQKQVTTVISNGDTMELLSGEDSLGHFDVVILAAPLQMCRIQFLTHNPMGMDTSILHPMPLGGVNYNDDNADAVSESKRRTNQHGDLVFPSKLLASATTPYTSVVTTIISNATINATHFGLEDSETIPQTILVSERGKELEKITTLRILSLNDGLVKIFSTEELSLEKRNMMLGKHHIIEYIQVWGGGDDNIEHAKYGGATPNFNGGRNSESLPFLLYDGATHWAKSDGSGPALYYVNAIESSVAAIEISAIGAKSVSKLVSRRLGLIGPVADTSHDEL